MKRSSLGSMKNNQTAKASSTDKLEQEAKEMETRLKVLQERMLQQQIEDANVIKQGGARWNGARLDKGSVLSYGKDLQEKYRKKREAEGGGDPALWLTSGKRDKSNRSGDIKTKDVTFWTRNDVASWLAGIGLNQYSESFMKNEISGLILLEISLEDLDYMGIKVLAHRKQILKGIEELKQNRRFKADAPTPQGANVFDNSNDNKSSSIEQTQPKVNINVDKLMEEANTKRYSHWTDNLAASNDSKVFSPMPVNAADSDMIDEEAEAKSFQDAVLAWRKSNRVDSHHEDTSPATSESLKLNENQLWHNPFSDELKESKTKTKVTIVYQSDDADDGIQRGKKSLLDGNFDEEAERKEFRKAVDAWRNSKNDQPSSNIIATQSIQSKNEASQMTSKLVAEELLKAFEAEQYRLTEEFNHRIEEAKKKNAMVEQSPRVNSSMSDRQNLNEYHKATPDAVESELDDHEIERLSEVSVNSNINDDIDIAIHSIPNIQLIESKLGIENDLDDSSYYVEIDSDDD